MDATRRTFLQAVGTLGVVGVTGLAGCNSAEAEDDALRLPEEPAYDGWFDGVETYRGTVDYRGQSTVAVTVGAKGGMGRFNFAPAAVAVSPGTTVTWEWTGKGGGHDVVAEDGTFQSELVNDAGATFSHTFDDPGIYPYFCTPHRGMGMKGAVVVLD